MEGDLELENSIHVPTRDEWRRWLEENHASQKEVWLVYFKKGTGKPTVSYGDALDEALSFGWIDGKVRRIDDEKYAYRYSPRKAGSRWSKANRQKAEKLIAEGRMTPAGMAAVEEARKSGAWDNAYPTRESGEMPPDLARALEENPASGEAFGRLSNSRRNAFIQWVNDAKTPATREKRIAEVVKSAVAPPRPRPVPGEKWWSPTP